MLIVLSHIVGRTGRDRGQTVSHSRDNLCYAKRLLCIGIANTRCEKNFTFLHLGNVAAISSIF